ncbi:A kinase (PRKA) anchor protein 7 isoform X2 [Brachyhypopomus gauderio]|uniref:A kinase (PRKA) anchor protein 7 isoform X2 n=1 Tax=Brachyhypopomus gauderio TaxID=698409 RepID=UPI004040ED0D
MFRRHMSLIRILNKSISSTFNIDTRSKAAAPTIQLARLIPLPMRPLSCVSQTQVDCASTMQPVPEPAARGAHKVRVQQDSKPVSSRRSESAVELPKDGSAGREHPSTDGKKVKRVRKKPKKVGLCRRRETQPHDPLCLLAELPFASVDTHIWKELGFSGIQESEKKKRKRAQKGQVESEGDGEKDKKKKKAVPRPNYFVSIPITNQKIKQGVEEVQALVLQKDARLARALIPPATLHVTLLVTHLATQEQVHTAALAVEEMESSLKSLLAGRSLVLPFRGIGHFRQEVAFIQVEEGEHLGTLKQIADLVRRAFEEKGIPSGDQKAFAPHLTFIKLSRAPKLRHQGIKKLDPALYEPFDQRVFGEECVCSLDLCSMLKKKSADGYYHREKTVTFGAKRGPELDDEELVSLSKRLVEDAVSRAVRQYVEEMTKNGMATKNEAVPPPQPPTASPNTTTTK